MGRALRVAVAVGASHAALRRIAHRTGVTDEEALGSFPGDGVVPHPMFEWNRGSTIDAPADAIWPWLAQMGYGRAGWYTPPRFDRWANRRVWGLEDQFPFEPSPWEIQASQHPLSAGDVVADGPGYAAYFRVEAATPNRNLVLWSLRPLARGTPMASHDEEALIAREIELRRRSHVEFSWAFDLRPMADGRTRLLQRSRSVVAPTWFRLLDMPFGLFDAYEGGGMLRGIKARVERGS